MKRKEFLEGSHAIAEAVKLCRPQVISAYPITPQTHIVERLADFVADGELKAEFINVESEHSACSVVLGAAACGARVFTATSSQGLILMSEVLFNAAGMRLPIVLVCANRALSAPINIWNDHQDSMAVRDSGWVQFYAENVQEAVDLIFASYRISEDPKILLPVMVCIDGYILTHGFEPVEFPSEEEVKKFLPPLNLPFKLDVENPLTLGFLGAPDCYLETRYALHQTHLELLEKFPYFESEFKNVFGKSINLKIESYFTQDADTIIIALGSVCGTMKEVVDSLRKKGEKVGLLKIISFRPLPKTDILKNLESAKRVLILDKSISLGCDGPVYIEIKSLLQGADKKIYGFIAGLGGRDITLNTILEMLKIADTNPEGSYFLDVKKELLRDEL